MAPLAPPLFTQPQPHETMIAINPLLRTGSRGLFGAALFAFSTAAVTARESDPFSAVVSLGDSLSDTGNFHEVTGGAYPPAPYYEGRFCNGPVWNEHLAGKLGMELDPDRQFALGGSLTGNLNYNSSPPSFILPGFEQQVDDVLAWNGRRKVDPRALYTIWVGANDFFAWLASGSNNPNPTITQGVANTVGGIAELSAAGARHFVVINLPDLGKTPTATGLGPFVSGLLSSLCASYNTLLDQQLNQLESDRRLNIVRVDAFALINDMVTNPATYGFTNVTQQALQGLPAADPDEYLFWDGVHPTTAAHEAVAEEVHEQLRAEYQRIRRPGWFATSATRGHAGLRAR
jgi:phospholipase/lecithinase/hemolysin